MTYKGYTIAAQESVLTILALGDSRELTNRILQDDFIDRAYTFLVCRDEACEDLVETELASIEDAKAYIDGLPVEVTV